MKITQGDRFTRRQPRLDADLAELAEVPAPLVRWGFHQLRTLTETTQRDKGYLF
jgi:hypothetical protein